MSLLQASHDRTNEFGKKTDKSLGKSKQKTSNEHLIPLLAILHWTNLSGELLTFNCRPQDWSLGSVCTCCSPWWVCSATGLKKSDVQGECCLLYQTSCKEVQPSVCCFWEGDLWPIAYKHTFPMDSNFEHRDVPCLCNVFGCNLAIDGQPRCGACQDIKTLKTGEWVHPMIPCVCGSCRNCSLIGECCGACKEACCSDAKVQVAAGVELTDKEASSAILSDVPAVEGVKSVPTKGETMARSVEDIKDKAKAAAIAELRSFGNGGRDQIGKTRLVDLKPCLGLVCCMTSVNDKFPECLGGFCEGLGLCFALSCTCAQPMVSRGDTFTGDVFLCTESRLGLVCPRTLASCQLSPCIFSGLCCFDCRVAIPFDGQDMPCILNILGLNLCLKCKPAVGCTWYAPLGIFYQDYEGNRGLDGMLGTTSVQEPVVDK